MITNRAKEESCKSLEAYLKLIYHFGRGVMLVVHIQRYMEHLEGKGKTSVWKDLRELQSKEVIDIHKIHNNSYVKLKKYALRYLLDKSSAKDTKSIKYGFAKIKKSIFTNEFILRYPLKGETIDEIIDYYSNFTTLINKDKKNTAILKNIKECLNTIEIQKEIKNLDSIYIQQIERLKTKDKGIKIKKINEFNLNNMQSRNIYISSIKNNTINIVFFDLNDSYTATKMAEHFELVYFYLRLLFKNININFTMITADLEGKERIKKQIPRLNQLLQTKHIFGDFKFNIVELNLRAKAFSNVKVLL